VDIAPSVEGENVQITRRMYRLSLGCAAAWFAASGLEPVFMSTVHAADQYPARPIRFVIPYPPGGGNDIVGRAIGERLGARLGQQVIVDNRSGGSGIIAAEIVAKSRNDGYTLLLGNSSTMAILPSLKPRLPYDPIKDYDPIMQLVTSPFLLVVNPGFPVATVKEFIALAKAKPGQLNLASSGQGSTGHLAAELFNATAGIKLTQVSYKGTGPAVADVLGGHIPAMFASSASVQLHVTAGRLRALGISTAKRNPAWPEIPTIAEAALPGYHMVSWNALVAPRGTPPAIIAKLHSEITIVFRDSELRQRLSGLGFDPDPSTQQELAALIRSEFVRFSKLAKVASLTMD
jgi:tripartite-type tricarboxylate transporter receptor subunit TctC